MIDGVQVETFVSVTGLFVSSTGNFNIITVGPHEDERCVRWKLRALSQRDRLGWLRVLGRQESPQVHALEDYFVFSVWHITIVPSYGRVHKLGCANKKGVYLLPEQLDEEVTTPHFTALGAALTVFSLTERSTWLAQRAWKA